MESVIVRVYYVEKTRVVNVQDVRIFTTMGGYYAHMVIGLDYNVVDDTGHPMSNSKDGPVDYHHKHFIAYRNVSLEQALELVEKYNPETNSILIFDINPILRHELFEIRSDTVGSYQEYEKRQYTLLTALGRKDFAELNQLWDFPLDDMAEEEILANIEKIDIQLSKAVFHEQWTLIKDVLADNKRYVYISLLRYMCHPKRPIIASVTTTFSNYQIRNYAIVRAPTMWVRRFPGTERISILLHSVTCHALRYHFDINPSILVLPSPIGRMPDIISRLPNIRFEREEGNMVLDLKKFPEFFDLWNQWIHTCQTCISTALYFCKVGTFCGKTCLRRYVNMMISTT